MVIMGVKERERIRIIVPKHDSRLSIVTSQKVRNINSTFNSASFSFVIQLQQIAQLTDLQLIHCIHLEECYFEHLHFFLLQKIKKNKRRSMFCVVYYPPVFSFISYNVGCSSCICKSHRWFGSQL